MEEYSTKQFYADMQTAGKEVLLIAEWIVVVAAFSWAAEKVQSVALYYFGFALNLLLALYLAVTINRFLWWAFPSLGPNKPWSFRTISAAAVSLAMGFGGLLLVEASFNALICAESKGTSQVQCDKNGPAAERSLYPSWLRRGDITDGAGNR